MLASQPKEVIGVVHLPRLPYAYYRPPSTISDLAEYGAKDAAVLEKLGYTGVIVENYGDAPFSPRVEDPLAIAAMTVIVREVVKSTSLKVGVNLLRNSGREAYSIAVAAGAKFIRVNALIEPVISDAGVLEPEAPRLKPLMLNYPGIEVYADILVKHATSLRMPLATLEAPTPLSKGALEDYLRELIEEYAQRGGASALVVTGLKTGEPPPLRLVELIKKLSPLPVIVGSGVTAENVLKVLEVCDGVIVGSFIKVGGRAGNPVDPERARTVISRIRERFIIAKY
ncbi:MAG: BtpA/SgcQ family protein [Desulfurococcaceae archaeon]